MTADERCSAGRWTAGRTVLDACTDGLWLQRGGMSLLVPRDELGAVLARGVEAAEWIADHGEAS